MYDRNKCVGSHVGSEEGEYRSFTKSVRRLCFPPSMTETTNETLRQKFRLSCQKFRLLLGINAEGYNVVVPCPSPVRPQLCRQILAPLSLTETQMRHSATRFTSSALASSGNVSGLGAAAAIWSHTSRLWIAGQYNKYG